MVSERVDDSEVLVDADQEDREDRSGADQAGAALRQVAHVALVEEASLFRHTIPGRHYRLPFFEDLQACVALDDDLRGFVEDLLAGDRGGVLHQGSVGDWCGWLFGLLVRQQERYQQAARQKIRQQEIDDESGRERGF